MELVGTTTIFKISQKESRGAEMSKITKAAASRRNQLSYAEFEVRHQSQLTEAKDIIGWPPESFNAVMLAHVLTHPRPSLPQLMQELKHTPLFRLLAAAGRENCPDALSFLLELWLRRMGVRIPAGVFVEPRGTRGRPPSRLGVYSTWIKIGQPPLAHTKLAVAIYGPTFKQANTTERKKMIDRCRKAVTRHQQSMPV